MYEYRCKLKRVIDGDSLVLHIDLGMNVQTTEKIRLLGVNTPEMRSRSEDERKAAVLATEYVKEWFASHHDLVIRTKLDKTGKFGRLLGDVYGADCQKFPEINKAKHPPLFLYDHLNMDLLKNNHAEAIPS